MSEQSESTISPSAGLDTGGRAVPEASRTGDDLLDAAADGSGLSPEEHDDLVAYFLTNDNLPGDDRVLSLEVKLGHGPSAKTFPCKVHPIEWAERQDAVDRATNKAGEFDAFVSSSWIVARALVEPRLGPTVARLQREDPDKAPEDAAALLRRMFRKQSGALLELSGKVLELSKLQQDNDSVREIEAAKN